MDLINSLIKLLISQDIQGSYKGKSHQIFNLEGDDDEENGLESDEFMQMPNTAVITCVVVCRK